MQSPKRTESRPPRPPVPKFRLIGAGTDTPDFLPPPKSEESSLFALSQDNMSETSNEESHDSYFARKRLQAIEDEMIYQIQSLGLSEELLKTGMQILKSGLLEELKSKKYNAIAVAVLIVALKQTCAPITQKEILAKTTVSEKQIKKIVMKISGSYKLDSIVYSFIKQISNQLGLNEKFATFCNQLFQFILSKNLIQGEHENVIAAAIVKFAGDIVFAERGGIVPSVISDHAKCSIGTMKQFLKKLEDRRELFQTAM